MLSRSLPDGTNSQPKPDDDIFETLLGKADSAPYSACIPGEQVSVTIATCPISDFSLQRARVVGNKLFMCRRCTSTDYHTLSIFVAGKNIKFGPLTTPTFPESPLKEYVLSLPQNASLPPPSGVLEHRPSLFVVRCVDPSNQTRAYCDASVSPDLFSKMFGPEITLSGSPVVLVGCKNGHILYSSLSQVGIDQSSQGHPLDYSSTLPFLYSLGQPVVSIHAVHFPERAIPELESLSAFNLPATSAAPSLQNTLVFIGRLGKIVICTSGLPSQRSPSFLEFHIPGPITSSLLVKDHALFYTTLSEVRMICVNESCVRAACECCPTNQLVLIPEVSLRIPERVTRVDAGTVLLNWLRVEALGSNEVYEIACLAPRGRVYCHKLNTKVCTERSKERSKERIDSTVLAEDLKQCLASIEITSDCLNQLSKKITKQDETLTELSQSLPRVCDVASCTEIKSTDQSDSNKSTDQSDSSRCPFRCKFEPCYEEVGVCAHKPCVDVQLTYYDNQSTPLSLGWALVIQSYASYTKGEDHPSQQRTSSLSGGSPKTVTSKLVPLTKLQPGCPVSTRVYLQLEPRQSLYYTLHCFLHYNASHLLERSRAGLHMTTPTSVTLPLCQKSFDAVDFLLPLQPSPRGLFTTSLIDPLRQIGSESADSHDLDAESHDLEELTFHTATAKVHKELGTADTNASRVLLCVLLGKQELIELVVEDTEETSLIELTSHSGSSVCFESTHSSHPDQLTLSVQSSSKSVLTEIGDCVQKRLSAIQRE